MGKISCTGCGKSHKQHKQRLKCIKLNQGPIELTGNKRMDPVLKDLEKEDAFLEVKKFESVNPQIKENAHFSNLNQILQENINLKPGSQYKQGYHKKIIEKVKIAKVFPFRIKSDVQLKKIHEQLQKMTQKEEYGHMNEVQLQAYFTNRYFNPQIIQTKKMSLEQLQYSKLIKQRTQQQLANLSTGNQQAKETLLVRLAHRTISIQHEQELNQHDMIDDNNCDKYSQTTAQTSFQNIVTLSNKIVRYSKQYKKKTGMSTCKTVYHRHFSRIMKRDQKQIDLIEQINNKMKKIDHMYSWKGIYKYGRSYYRRAFGNIIRAKDILMGKIKQIIQKRLKDETSINIKNSTQEIKFEIHLIKLIQRFFQSTTRKRKSALTTQFFQITEALNQISLKQSEKKRDIILQKTSNVRDHLKQVFTQMVIKRQKQHWRRIIHKILLVRYGTGMTKYFNRKYEKMIKLDIQTRFTRLWQTADMFNVPQQVRNDRKCYREIYAKIIEYFASVKKYECQQIILSNERLKIRNKCLENRRNMQLDSYGIDKTDMAKVLRFQVLKRRHGLNKQIQMTKWLLGWKLVCDSLDLDQMMKNWLQYTQRGQFIQLSIQSKLLVFSNIPRSYKPILLPEKTIVSSQYCRDVIYYSESCLQILLETLKHYKLNFQFPVLAFQLENIFQQVKSYDEIPMSFYDKNIEEWLKGYKKIGNIKDLEMFMKDHINFNDEIKWNTIKFQQKMNIYHSIKKGGQMPILWPEEIPTIKNYNRFIIFYKQSCRRKLEHIFHSYDVKVDQLFKIFQIQFNDQYHRCKLQRNMNRRPKILIQQNQQQKWRLIQQIRSKLGNQPLQQFKLAQQIINVLQNRSYRTNKINVQAIPNFITDRKLLNLLGQETIKKFIFTFRQSFPFISNELSILKCCITKHSIEPFTNEMYRLAQIQNIQKNHQVFFQQLQDQQLQIKSVSMQIQDIVKQDKKLQNKQIAPMIIQQQTIMKNQDQQKIEQDINKANDNQPEIQISQMFFSKKQQKVLQYLDKQIESKEQLKYIRNNFDPQITYMWRICQTCQSRFLNNQKKIICTICLANYHLSCFKNCDCQNTTNIPDIEDQLIQFKLVDDGNKLYNIDNSKVLYFQPTAEEKKIMTQNNEQIQQKLQARGLKVCNKALIQAKMLKNNKRIYEPCVKDGGKYFVKAYQKYINNGLAPVNIKVFGNDFFGIEATFDIKANTILGQYAGDIFSMKYSNIYGKGKHKDHILSLFIGQTRQQDYIIVPFQHGNWVCLINFSPRPNTQFLKIVINGSLKILVKTKKDIKAGEQLTLNYNGFFNDYDVSEFIDLY